ncbi:MAG TPA: hypothetical protein VIL78_07755 [Hanamia sp.]
MEQYSIDLDKKKYVFDIYQDRLQVTTEKPTIIVYMKKQGAAYKKTFCEFVENPKNYLYDNPPVKEALSNNIFLLLQRDDTEIDNYLRTHYKRIVLWFDKYFKCNDIELN